MKILDGSYKWIRSWFVKDKSYKEKGKVYARKEEKLKCPCGKIMDTIYECGHLAICSKCDEELEIKECRICGNISETT